MYLFAISWDLVPLPWASVLQVSLQPLERRVLIISIRASAFQWINIRDRIRDWLFLVWRNDGDRIVNKDVAHGLDGIGRSAGKGGGRRLQGEKGKDKSDLDEVLGCYEHNRKIECYGT